MAVVSDPDGEAAVAGVNDRGVGDASFVQKRSRVHIKLGSGDLDDGHGTAAAGIAFQMEAERADRLAARSFDGRLAAGDQRQEGQEQIAVEPRRANLHSHR